MKFAYIDESGTGDEPYAVMAGVIIDAQRMRPTKDDWGALLTELSIITGKEVKEFHTRDFYAGNKPWRGLAGDKRGEIITTIFQWFAERRHQIFFSAIDKKRLKDEFSEHPITNSLGSLWQILASHFALSIQRAHQSQKNNKGNTVLVFDAHDKDQREFSEFIINPPDWADSYYSRTKKQKRFDQIIDVPHFVDSHHVGMIQLADCISFFLRRHLELSDGKQVERYVGELDVVSNWVDSIMERCTSIAAIYPKRQRCRVAEYYYQLAPPRFRHEPKA